MKTVLTKSAVSLLAALLVSACVLGGGQTRYRLIDPEVEAPAAPERATVDEILAVSRPETDRTRDSASILVRRDRTLLPWKGSAWIDRAPDLLQGLLVAYLDGRVATVGEYGSLPAAFRLDLVIRRFEFVELSGGLQAELVLVARVFAADGELLDVTTLTRRESSGGDSIDQAVSAMEAAMQATFAELADWLQSRLARPAAQSTAAEGQ